VFEGGKDVSESWAVWHFRRHGQEGCLRARHGGPVCEAHCDALCNGPEMC
jgi:hypothetical protein